MTEKLENEIECLSAAAARYFSEPPRFFVRTYGCQQNVSDSERIKGMLCAAGFAETDDEEQAGIIVFNTCAIREHAEDRVFGNVGRLKPLKENGRRLVIALGGCMVQQPRVAQEIKAHFPYVSVLFDTNRLAALPGLLADYMLTGKRVFSAEEKGGIEENVPVLRAPAPRAFLPIMYGCDNFCTYCIVPYVRHRERSRAPQDIVREFRELVAGGYKEITLLGQNVNSYGKGGETDFPGLLETLAAQDGDFIIRFMTSHPKDATKRLIDVIADNPKISRHFHLPVQSGSDRILKMMNRHYDVSQYLSLVDYARERVPDISFTSDIIVGFPGETREDFDATLELVRRVRYKNLFTFIYSKREGTPAAAMEDDTPHKLKAERLIELNELQDGITRELESALIGRTLRGLPEPCETGAGVRLDNNSVVFTADALPETGDFCRVEITSYENGRLCGRLV